MTSAQSPILSAHGVFKSWKSPAGAIPVLAGISLSIGAGESVAITGCSGSGKSTLLHLLAGLTQPDAGRIDFEGRPIDDANGIKSLRRASAFVFQDAKLIPGLTIYANTCVPLEHRGVATAVQRRVVGALLERVGLGDRRLHYPRQLSGGELMRAAIARALISAPRIVFADEPTGSLDDTTAQYIIELLLEFCGRGASLLVVTHNRELASRLQRRHHLTGGRLEA
jgi:predicted ABC-type transport system involved in lysophospholipase L1 biosynthesis ATPase subunit